MAKKKWMQGLKIKKGALHIQMHIPKDKKIPTSKLVAAKKKGGLLAKRATLALTFRRSKNG